MRWDLNATVTRVAFSNHDNSWCVLEVECADGVAVRVTGALACAVQGMQLMANGRWDTHAGNDVLRVSEYRVFQPVTTSGIVRFLASDAVPGVGMETANAIVTVFGNGTLDIIRKNPERLIEVKGLGQKRSDDIAKAVIANAERLEAMIFLHERFGDNRSDQIFAVYGTDAPRVIGENPYRLIRDVDGIGFKTADDLGTGLGFARNCYERVSAGVYHAILARVRRGDTAVEISSLMNTVTDALGVDTVVTGQAISRLCTEGTLVSYETGNRRYYALPAIAGAENAITHRLAGLLNTGSCIPTVANEDTFELIDAHTSLQLTGEQTQAISSAIKDKVCVITGGPGTGKTAVLDAVRRILNRKGVVVHLCAPTGLAARRMREATGHEACTIHRLLEYEPVTGRFTRHDCRPLPAGVVVMDESSMCDVRLLSALTRAMTPQSHLVLIGDSEQLPSVSSGCVLRDIIQSGVVPIVRLSHTFRQQSGSRIISLAHTISQGLIPRLESGRDVTFLEATKSAEVMALVVDQVMSFVRNPNVNVRDDIQVITPRNRGPLSVREANNGLQRALNPSPSRVFKRNGYTFGVGDKVMQTVNDADRELSNGDIGWIRAISADGTSVHVVMAQGLVEYTSGQLRQLVLAYAVTAHKAQGSEFPIVILAVDRSSYMLFDRTLLYTAVTRAKQDLIVIGDGRAIRLAVTRDESLNRTTTLGSRLRTALRNIRETDDSVVL